MTLNSCEIILDDLVYKGLDIKLSDQLKSQLGKRLYINGYHWGFAGLEDQVVELQDILINDIEYAVGWYEGQPVDLSSACHQMSVQLSTLESLNRMRSDQQLAAISEDTIRRFWDHHMPSVRAIDTLESWTLDKIDEDLRRAYG